MSTYEPAWISVRAPAWAARSYVPVPPPDITSQSVDARATQGDQDPVQQVGPAGHGHRRAAGLERAARRTISGDDHEPAPKARARPGAGAGRRPPLWRPGRASVSH